MVLFEEFIAAVSVLAYGPAFRCTM